MSRQFRSTFRSMFCLGPASPAAAEMTEGAARASHIPEHTNYVSLAGKEEHHNEQEDNQLLAVERTVESHL